MLKQNVEVCTDDPGTLLSEVFRHGDAHCNAFLTNMPSDALHILSSHKHPQLSLPVDNRQIDDASGLLPLFGVVTCQLSQRFSLDDDHTHGQVHIPFDYLTHLAPEVFQNPAVAHTGQVRKRFINRIAFHARRNRLKGRHYPVTQISIKRIVTAEEVSLVPSDVVPELARGYAHGDPVFKLQYLWR